jgi:hypothetical protein
MTAIELDDELIEELEIFSRKIHLPNIRGVINMAIENLMRNWPWENNVCVHEDCPHRKSVEAWQEEHK